MPSVNVDLDYPNHPKTKRLVGILGPGAEALPVLLWCYAGKYHRRDGTLTGYSEAEIESLVSWGGKAGRAIAAMVKVGFLDPIDGGFQIHDWRDHAGHLEVFHERAKKASEANLERIRRRLPASSSATSSASSSACEEVKLASCSPLPDQIRSDQYREERDAPVGARPAVAGPPPSALVTTWNENRGALPEARGAGKGREKHARARLREVPDLERWAAATRRLAASPFASGTNDRGWVATLDFLLRPDTLLRVEEGAYDRRNGNGTGKRAAPDPYPFASPAAPTDDPADPYTAHRQAVASLTRRHPDRDRFSDEEIEQEMAHAR